MADDTNNQHECRVEKLNLWQKQYPSYPNKIKNTHSNLDIIKEFDKFDKEALASQAVKVSLSGRMMTQRLMGKASFAHIKDGSGTQLQWYLRLQDLPEGVFDFYKTCDLGDIVHASGYLFKTNKGELSLYVEKFQLLAKSLWPLPDKYHGLQDVEARYRKRYLDLIVNDDAREIFVIRSKVIAAIREFLSNDDFMEVETPMMQSLAGGAAARPFITHHNALDMPLFLRIAPELYLKRLIVGGFDKVFELNRNFRNEGVSTRHNPEFTMVEFYQAYATYEDLMVLTQQLLKFVVQKVFNKTKIKYQGVDIDFAKEFACMTMTESIMQYNDVDAATINNLEKLKAFANSINIAVDDNICLGKLHVEIFEKTVEKQLIQPTFITEYPKVSSPLARLSDHNAELTDRFEFFMGGAEVANGFSELNDPIDQASRFKDQVKERESGDSEAMHYDADYVQALEYGMPPTAGEGIGIDRLVMCLVDSQSIKNVILFPLLK